MMPKQIRSFFIEKQIGRGSNGLVYKAVHEKSKVKVAIKMIPKFNLSNHDQIQLQFSREINLLQRINHIFVPQFYQIIEDSENFYLVMEYAPNGDLVSLHKPVDEYTAKMIFLQLIIILEYLHDDLYIVHRDLKAENVMLDKYNNIRVIDYGLSNCFTEETPHLKTTCGSPCMYFFKKKQIYIYKKNI